mgnify:CR=1 FL=1|tara:strand:- start:254 stop:436 length:183 start_codon:yes stop_codon:yes gene_type:complete
MLRGILKKIGYSILHPLKSLKLLHIYLAFTAEGSGKEVDEDLKDHNDPDHPFRLDIGGES